MSSDAEFAVPQSPAADTASLAHDPPAAPLAQSPQFQQAPLSQPAQQIILPKNPALGVILSFFIPGLGSIVNGSTGRGVAILGLYVFGWILAFFLIGIPILIGAFIWGLVDGYLSAQRWNQAHGIVS
jgi:TM2 domain-containing membrane protein YozV